MQMRDVASRAQVALGTIYRYFASKDHLLAACQLEMWRVDRAAPRHPPAHRRHRGRPGGRADPAADAPGRAGAAAGRGAHHRVVVARPGGAGVPGRDDRAPGRHLRGRDGRPRPRGARPAWPGCCARCGSPTLLGWVNGWNDAKAVTVECEIAIHLLLDDLPVSTRDPVRLRVCPEKLECVLLRPWLTDSDFHSRHRVPVHPDPRVRSWDRFSPACATGRSCGIRANDGRILVPPLEWDPNTGEALDTDRPRRRRARAGSSRPGPG